MKSPWTEKLPWLERVGSVTASTITLFILASLFGRLILWLLNLNTYNLLYDFVFGIGILAAFTFIIAVYEEFKGDKNGIQK